MVKTRAGRSRRGGTPRNDAPPGTEGLPLPLETAQGPPLCCLPHTGPTWGAATASSVREHLLVLTHRPCCLQTSPGIAGQRALGVGSAFQHGAGG